METDAILASSEWVSAGGLILLLIGISLLVVEFFVPSFGLFGFAGVTSILIGVVQLHQTGHIENMPISVNALIIMAIIGILLSAAGGWYSWKLYQQKVTTGIEGMIGDTATVLKWKNQSGRVHVQGEDWQAYSDEKLTLQADDKVIVAKVDGLKIKIISNL